MNKRHHHNQPIVGRDYRPALDFGLQGQNPSKLRSPIHWMGLLASVALITSIFFMLTDNAKATRTEQAAIDDALPLSINKEAINKEATNKNTIDGKEGIDKQTSRVSLPLAIPESAISNTVEHTSSVSSGNSPNNISDNALPWHTTTVKSGDNLALIFNRMGLSPQELYHVVQADKQSSQLKHLMPGQKLKFQIQDGSLQQMVYKIDNLNTLQVNRDNNDDFAVSTITRKMQTRVAHARGVIDSSLFLAGHDAGLSDNLIMELAGIFGWDIDFALDIRHGDHFSVVYEENYLDGRKQSDGDILAAEFVSRGKTYRAVRFTDAKGNTDYYSPDGKSMRKAFLRTPVAFTRISSRFGMRYHPMLHKMKNHHGVDYAAPIGTPIKAAGDGKLIFVGRQHGYGNVIIIQHGGKYSTLYAHMSHFKRGMHRGKRVHQGQVIGYVGSTGRSTGPHLHYEFRINGVHRNPLTVHLPDAAPISAKYKNDFLKKSRGLVALLDVLDRSSTLALNDSDK